MVQSNAYLQATSQQCSETSKKQRTQAPLPQSKLCLTSLHCLHKPLHALKTDLHSLMHSGPDIGII